MAEVGQRAAAVGSLGTVGQELSDADFSHQTITLREDLQMAGKRSSRK